MEETCLWKEIEKKKDREKEPRVGGAGEKQQKM